MKQVLLITYILLFSSSLLSAQTSKEESDAVVKKIFSEEYNKSSYKKYRGKITCNHPFYTYGEKTLRVTVTDTNLMILFEKGIFNPDVIFGKNTIKALSKAEADTSSTTRLILVNMVRNDSLTICCMKELKVASPNPQTKRYSFWLFRLSIQNPTEYYMELNNKRATSKTSLKAFLRKSRLTFFLKGSTII